MSYLRSMDDLVAGNFVAEDPDWNWSVPEDDDGPGGRSARRPALTCFWTLDAIGFRPICTWMAAD